MQVFAATNSTKQEKANILKRLVNDFKETRALYRKKKAKKASKAELKELERRMKKIKRAAVIAGVIVAFLAAVAAGTAGAYAYSKHKDSTEPFPTDTLSTEVAKLDETPITAEQAAAALEITPEQAAQKMSLVEIVQAKYTDNQFKSLNFEQLIQQKKDQINNPDQYGQPALLIAIEKLDTPMVKLLVTNGANTAIENIWGNQPLHIYVQNNDLSTAQFLVDTGSADVNAKNTKTGNTPLHIATEKNNQQMIGFLLDRKANLNIQNNSGKTPLHKIVKNKKLLNYLVRTLFSKHKLTKVLAQEIRHAANEEGITISEQVETILNKAN